MEKHKLVIAAAIVIALAVLAASAAADTTFTMNIYVTSPNTYVSAPQDISVPDNATKLTISADTTDIQIDIHLYDPSGRHTGAIYPIGEETNIPNSTYSGWNTDPEIITVVPPAPGNYTLKAYGYYTTGWANITTPICIYEGLSHLSGRVMGYMRNGTFIPLKDVTINVTYSQNGTLYKTFPDETNANGEFLIDVPPYTEIDLKFSKVGFYERSEEGVRTFGPCETYDLGVVYQTEKPLYGTLIVDVYDYRTGNKVGTFSVPDTEGGGPWQVPEVEVTVWDSMTKEFITSNETKNGTTTLVIPMLPGANIRIVDVNNTEVREWSDNTTAYPGVTKGSEMGIMVIVNTTKIAILEVMVINPPAPGEKYLKVSVTPDIVKIGTDTEVTATVTDKYIGEAVKSTTVTLSGCGVSEKGHTGADGKVNFTIHPIALGQITVTANKSGYNDGVTTIYAREHETREFNTGEGDYPSIMGTHNGTITPAHKVIANKLYTYPCAGTGGHAEYARIWNSLWSISGTWEGYRGDWHNITFNETFVLEPGETYNYSVRTGSYPQIIHKHNLTTADGMITCAEFIDANGKNYNDWIPALRLFFVPSPEKAHITGRVMGRLADGSLIPLGDVDVTATYSANMSLCGMTITGANGYFTIDVPPYSVVDLKFTKVGYGSYCEEGIDLTDYGPCETYDIGTMFMTKKPGVYCVDITADPMSNSVCVNEDATYILTVCNCADIPDTIVLSITAGPGTLNKTTFPLDPGKCDVAELTVRSSTAGTFPTTVRATSQGDPGKKDEVTVTTTVMGANLKVFVRDYVTGNLVGTFSKTNTTAGTECNVPELWVEVKDITGELIKGKLTTNGTADFYIPPTTYPKVDVFANGNRSLDWYMPNVDKSMYYVPWIEPGSESGVTISTVPTIASVYVGVKEPPVHYLAVNAITSGRDKKIIVNTTEEVTAEVTGSYSCDGRMVTESIPHVTVRLTGAGVVVPDQMTDNNGIATFGAVTPTTVEDITVTATKPLCFIGDTDTISIYETLGCPVIEVRVVDAGHSDIKIAPSTVGVTAGVALYNLEGTMVTKPIDVGVIWDNGPGDPDPEEGVILIDTGHIDLAQAMGQGWFSLIVTSDPPRYSDDLEHGIYLQLDCEAPMKGITTPLVEI